MRPIHRGRHLQHHEKKGAWPLPNNFVKKFPCRWWNFSPLWVYPTVVVILSISKPTNQLLTVPYLSTGQSDATHSSGSHGCPAQPFFMWFWICQPPSKRTKAARRRLLWCGTDLNRRHPDFQSSALPTELPHRFLRMLQPLDNNGAKRDCKCRNFIQTTKGFFQVFFPVALPYFRKIQGIHCILLCSTISFSPP